MTDTLGFEVGPPEGLITLGSFAANADWLEERLGSRDLVPAVDEALGACVLSLLGRIQEGAMRIQLESNGRAFGEAFAPRIVVNPRPVTSILDRVPDRAIGEVPSVSGLVLGWIALPGGDLRLVTTWTEVGEGSFWSRLGAALEHGTLIAAATLALAGPVEDVHRDLNWQGQIDRYLNGAPCRSVVTFEPDLDALRQHTAQSLRLDGLAPGSQAYTSTVCALQLLLRWAGKHPGPIDGVLGNQTRDAMASFAREHGLAPEDPRVLDLLVDRVQRPRD